MGIISPFPLKKKKEIFEYANNKIKYCLNNSLKDKRVNERRGAQITNIVANLCKKMSIQTTVT